MSSALTLGEWLNQTAIDRGDNQAEIADWVEDWLDHHDVERYLDDLERTASSEQAEHVHRVCAVIRDAIARRVDLTGGTVSQAAVSKWRNGHTTPSPPKWPALAAYLGIPLHEEYDLITKSKVPPTAVRLRDELNVAHAEITVLREQLGRLDGSKLAAELAELAAENELLRSENREQDERLVRGEEALRRAEQANADLEDRAAELEAKLRDLVETCVCDAQTHATV